METNAGQKFLPANRCKIRNGASKNFPPNFIVLILELLVLFAFLCGSKDSSPQEGERFISKAMLCGVCRFELARIFGFW